MVLKAAPGPLCHRFVAIDEGAQALWLIDTQDPDFGWRLDLTRFPLARDLQLLDGGRLLVGWERGFVEIELAGGRVMRVNDAWRDVTAARRCADGTTLLTGLNLDGNGGVNVLTLDADLQLAASARRDGDYVRLLRPTAAGTWLLCANQRVIETDTELRLVREFSAPGFLHAWMAERLDDGTTLVAAGYGAFMARFDADGNLTQTFGGKAQVASEIAPFFYACFQRLSNGHLLVANWQGHGPDNGGKGRQLLEFDGHGELLGNWSCPRRLSSLQGILVVA